MRISDIFKSKEKPSKKLIIRMGLIFTGMISLIIVLVTFYGQYTGTYLITMTKEAHRKGIALSETVDFKELKTDLRFNPLNDIEDTIESFLNIEEAEKHDGQYYEEGQNYLAYTFYLKNTGVEVVNINYRLHITEEYKRLGEATIVKIREYENNNNNFNLIKDENYSKIYSKENTIANVTIENFKPEEVRKFTIFIWFDGKYTNKEMMGGAIKMEWTFGIINALGEEK